VPLALRELDYRAPLAKEARVVVKGKATNNHALTAIESSLRRENKAIFDLNGQVRRLPPRRNAGKTATMNSSVMTTRYAVA
jgi:hypothetical protein